MKSKKNTVVPNELTVKIACDFSAYSLESRVLKYLIKQTFGQGNHYTELDLTAISKSLKRDQADIAFSIIQLAKTGYLVFIESENAYYIGFRDSWFALFQIAQIEYQRKTGS